MPCKCSGLKLERCKCKVLHTGYCNGKAGSVVLLSHSNSLCRLLDLKAQGKTNFLFRILETVYETCAGYNLRYCPIRGFVKHDNHLGNAMKDFIILFCFLVANFVVFVTILTKMMVHIYFVVKMTAQWINRSFMSKVDSSEENVALNPAQYSYDYNPPITRFFETRAKCW